MWSITLIKRLEERSRHICSLVFISTQHLCQVQHMDCLVADATYATIRYGLPLLHRSNLPQLMPHSPYITVILEATHRRTIAG